MSNINDTIKSPSFSLVSGITKIKGVNGVLYTFPLADVKVKDGEINIQLRGGFSQNYTFNELSTADRLNKSNAEELIDEYAVRGYMVAPGGSGSGGGPANAQEISARYVYDDGADYARLFEVFSIDEDTGAGTVTYYDAPAGNVVTLTGNAIPVSDSQPLLDSQMAHIAVDDTQVYTLADGSTDDTSSTAQAKPADAVGVRIQCRILSTTDPLSIFIRYTDNTADTPTNTWGKVLYDGDEVVFGITADTPTGSAAELDSLKFISSPGTTAELILQYFKRP